MANNQPNRHTKSANVPEHQKLNGNEINQSVAKTITNINYDCLEHIFDVLDKKNILNLAQTCKRLQIAAAAKFADDHGNKCIILHPFYFRIDGGVVRINDNVIFVNGLELCLSFLRCFGYKILDLHVIFGLVIDEKS